jgi:hypothetical protein
MPCVMPRMAWNTKLLRLGNGASSVGILHDGASSQGHHQLNQSLLPKFLKWFGREQS